MTPARIFGAPEGFDAVLVARRAAERREGPVLMVARDDARFARLSDLLGFFAPGLPVLRFPAWDCLPYDRASPIAAVVAERMATLAHLAEGVPAPCIVLTTITALVQRVPPREGFAGASFALRAGVDARPEQVTAFLEAHGYARTETVRESGEYAWRAGILDVFASGEADPVRVDFFGDTVESLKYFDVETQRSAETLATLTLRPVAEIGSGAEAVSRFREGWRELFGLAATEDPIYQAVSDGRRHPGLEHWEPLFYERMAVLTEYLDAPEVVLDHQALESLDARLAMIADHYAARRAVVRDGEVPYRPLPPDRLYLDRDGFERMLGAHPVVQLSPFAMADGAAGIDAGGRPGPLFKPGERNVFDQFADQAASWTAQKRRPVLAAWSRGSRERLAALLREHGMKAEPVEAWGEIGRVRRDAVALLTLPIERGFVAEDVAVVGEQDLLGERISRPARRRKRAEEFIAQATEIAEGDLVVHEEYGIGRYDGLETLTVGNAPHDCLRLVYDGSEKLFLPVENIELLSRFGSDAAGVALDKLGGASWQTRKARARQRIRDMAGELIRTAAERRLREAPLAIPPEGTWDEFCARFPFAETEDQSRAIADVIEDLASGRPMDRLICGDVGFGKTEVALRAAFVVAMSGGQVAVTVPTTLLARQHFRTFSARFAGMGVRVAQLSRLVAAKEAAEVRQGLKDGSVGVVIGTHTLLGKGIEFANLELLIVDEEQHFGVAHKEKLKALKADVHVLTLSATPIPRTLQLALTGVREMSLIATPPVDRMAVRTFIMPWDGVVLREAIQRERFRGGQAFCVVPRIEDMDRVAERIREIVPEAKMVAAHGKLRPTEIERVMTEFGDGRYDILLSTNIVESGLDMSAVNTLIIHRADLFGLGQLYQLRGRVGRGKQRGYAYLTWPQSQKLSAAAEKRLNVMQSLDTLGAGFTLASHDLDLRGAGNLLGEEQSGHVREVGVELYQSMLEDAVAELRTEKGRRRAADRDWTPTINLGLPVLIPEDYVRDLPVRLGLYRRIGSLATDAEGEAMAAELVDRFGPLPAEVENLLQTVALKRACRQAGVEKLEAGPKAMVVTFRGNAFRNPSGLVAWLGARKGALKLRPDHKLAVMRDMSVSERVRVARDILADLNRIAEQAKAA